MNDRISMRAILAFGVMLTAIPAQPTHAAEVIPRTEFKGLVAVPALRVHIPKNGFITDKKTFRTMWLAWRTDDPTKVDFDKEFVVVMTCGGPNRPSGSYVVNDGNLLIETACNLKGGPGFGYCIAVLSRKGIETVGGKPLPKPAARSEQNQ